MTPDGFIPFDLLHRQRAEAMELDAAEDLLNELGLRMFVEDWRLDIDGPAAPGTGATGEGSMTDLQRSGSEACRLIALAAAVWSNRGTNYAHPSRTGPKPADELRQPWKRATTSPSCAASM